MPVRSVGRSAVTTVNRPVPPSPSRWPAATRAWGDIHKALRTNTLTNKELDRILLKQFGTSFDPKNPTRLTDRAIRSMDVDAAREAAVLMNTLKGELRTSGWGVGSHVESLRAKFSEQGE